MISTPGRESATKCKSRDWHRVRDIEDGPVIADGAYPAICADCAAMGDLEWASVNLLREYASEEREW